MKDGMINFHKELFAGPNCKTYSDAKKRTIAWKEYLKAIDGSEDADFCKNEYKRINKKYDGVL